MIEEGTQVSQCNHEDPVKLIMFLTTEVKKLMNWFKTVRGVSTDEEIVDIAEIIKETYWYLKMEEISFCFSRVKSGRTSIKVYDRLDGSVIMKFLHEHDTTTRTDWSEAKADISKKLGEPDTAIMTEFNKEEFYSKGKEYIEEQKAKSKKRQPSVGMRQMSQDEKRRQYELIIPDCSPEELKLMLKNAEKEGNTLLTDIIKNKI